MQNKKIKIIIVLFAIGIFFTVGNSVWSQEELVNQEVKELNSEIQNKKDEIKRIQDKQEEYSKRIKEKQKEKSSLINQLSILDNRIAKSELDIESAEIEIDRINLEIKKTDLEIKNKAKEIEKEKENVAGVLRLMQKKDQVSALEILLLNNSFTEFMNQVKYLGDINAEIKNKIDLLKEYKDQLEAEEAKLTKENKNLLSTKEDLEKRKETLDYERNNKTFVLDQTKSSEKEYQRLLALAKKEQEQAAAEIAGLENTVRKKISQLSGNKLEFNDKGFIWPVPQNTITTLFHDPDYPFRNIFEHPAVDIRASQGTVIKAAASGYVARAKNAGSGYSYIMLIHGNELATVYGHVSKIYVEEDEYVVQGQTIGLSGGMPGTPGAGRLTTGPHLHFEVRSNGIPVNPASYLP